MKGIMRYRYLALAMIGVALFVAGVLLERGRRQDVTRTTDRTAARVVRGSLGPTPGPDAEGYITAKRDYLTKEAERAPSKQASGLVSLSRLATAGDVETLMTNLQRAAGGRRAARVELVFVRFPGGDPGVLAVDSTVEIAVARRAREVAEQLTAEAQGFERQAAAAPAQPDKQELLRKAAEKLSSANSATAACSCVYGLLIARTTLQQLEALLDDPAVRLVDVPRPPQADLRGWELRPILPKEAVPSSGGSPATTPSPVAGQTSPSAPPATPAGRP